MPRFSVIVLQTDDSYLFDNTLASILRSRDENTRVIVSHDGTYQDPYGLKSEVEFVSTGRTAGLAGLFNNGLRATEDEIVALIRPGIELPEAWQSSVEAAFKSRTVAAVSPLMIDTADPRRIVTAGVTCGRGYNRKVIGQSERVANRVLKRLKPLGPTSWAAFYRRDALAEIGACDEQLDDHYLDLDLALGLRTLGYKCVLQHECRVSIERAFPVQRESTLPHGTSAQRALRRHHPDASVGDSVLSFMSDLAQAAFRPWMFTHATQRMSATRQKDIDSLFVRRIQRIIDHRKLGTPAEEVIPAIAGRIDSGTQPARSRRSKHQRKVA